MYDVDGGPDDLLTFVIECVKGELILGDISGLIFDGLNESYRNKTNTTLVGSSSPPPASNLRFRGTAADINRAMRDFRYRGLPGLVGEDLIRVTVTDDPGLCPGDENFTSSPELNTTTAPATAPCTLGGPRTTGETMAVFLSAVNRPPTVKVPLPEESTRTTLDAAYSVEIGARGGVSVEDPDARETVYYSAGGLKIEGPVTVDVIAEKGHLTLGVRGGLSFAVGEGISDSALRFSGGIDDVNSALNTLSYRCSTAVGCELGTDKVNVSVNDNGFTGKGGPMSATATFSIEVELERQ